MIRIFLLTLITCLLYSCSNQVLISVPEKFKTIQEAIDSASYGDTVLVGPGIYHERIKLKEGVILKSSGDDSKGKLGLLRAEKTIIDGSRTEDNRPGVEMAENSVIDGFTVTGVGKYDKAKWEKHFETKGEMQSHDHIGAPGVAGISAKNDCKIKNNIVHHIGYTGIALMGKNCIAKVKMNICYRNMGGGIGSMSKSRALIEKNICFENFYAGIGHDDASPKVLNNVCYGNIRAGIGISEGASPLVSGNICYKNRRAGIGIRTGSATRPKVENNQCFENGMAGIGIKDDARPTIKNNKCYKNKLAGIGIRNNGRPQIIGNECYENGMSGIGSMGSENLIISKNFCHHNKSSGIGFSPTENGRAEVTGNKVIDNGTVAVGIQSGWRIKLANNLISRKGGMPPLVMIFKGSQVDLNGNVFKGGGVAALRLSGEADLKNNTFSGDGPRKTGPPNFGVWALAGSRVKMTANSISGWRHALYASGSEVIVSGNKIYNFWGTAIVVVNPSKPLVATGNTAFSSDLKAKVIKAGNPHKLVEGNKLLQP